MDKDTKIEILKIVGMVVILAALIVGIFFMNKKENIDENNINTTVEETTTETESNSEENTEENTDLGV